MQDITHTYIVHQEPVIITKDRASNLLPVVITAIEPLAGGTFLVIIIIMNCWQMIHHHIIFFLLGTVLWGK